MFLIFCNGILLNINVHSAYHRLDKIFNLVLLLLGNLLLNFLIYVISFSIHYYYYYYYYVFISKIIGPHCARNGTRIFFQNG